MTMMPWPTDVSNGRHVGRAANCEQQGNSVLSFDALIDLLADRVAGCVIKRLSQGVGHSTGGRLFSTSEAAEYIGCGRHTLYNEVACGKLHAVRSGKRRWRFAIEDLNAWINSNRQ